MRYYTGDESGLVKWVAFPPKIKKRRSKEVTEPLMVFSHSYGKVDKSEAVQKLIWIQYQDQKQLLVARKSGRIDIMCPETGAVNKQFNQPKMEGAFIGVFMHNNHICACTSSGELSYTSLEDSTLTTIHKLSDQLEIMRQHPTQTNLFAVGGKQRDLAVYDINALLEKKKGLIFQAKNVKNDFLDLEQPIWIHDLQFMNEEATLIAVATHYHQFRLYNTKKGRRPILNVEIGKHPLKTLTVGKDYNHVIYSDTMSTVGTIHIHTGQKSAQYKGFTGAVTDLVIAPTPTFNQETTNSHLISVSLDRFIRVHETTTVYRELIDKAYLKQRLLCILVDEEYEYPVPDENKEDDDVWDSLEVAKDIKRKRTSN
ncbi:WD40-repeat-containing domain protein [Pilobolus umbonatus]|nr:WD40-repeat-containing domain protein [Pilobolus umbonatus]